MLLCSHHHRLLHDGGFTIRRDAQGEIYFQRPDGRVIPRFGYRLEDMRDDDVGSDEPTRNPSAEVRETRGVYMTLVYGRHNDGRRAALA
ncbi:hypothetical protein D3C83_62020 [compost metagenome]